MIHADALTHSSPLQWSKYFQECCWELRGLLAPWEPAYRFLSIVLHTAVLFSLQKGAPRQKCAYGYLFISTTISAISPMPTVSLHYKQEYAWTWKLKSSLELLYTAIMFVTAIPFMQWHVPVHSVKDACLQTLWETWGVAPFGSNSEVQFLSLSADLGPYCWSWTQLCLSDCGELKSWECQTCSRGLRRPPEVGRGLPAVLQSQKKERNWLSTDFGISGGFRE